jgi:hypothetical protein
MITKVEVRNKQGSLLSLQLDDDTDSFLVLGIDGLGPVKATLVSSSFAGLDGEQLNSKRRETRNIKIQMGLRPDPAAAETVEGLRFQLYAFFMPESDVSLRFYTDGDLTLDILGTVETCDPAIFSQESDMDISIMCYSPDFFDPTPEIVTGNTTSTSTTTVISNDGFIETGMVFTLNVNRTLTEFTLYNTPPNDTVRSLDFSGSLAAGDVLVISTIPGSKGVTLTRSGVVSSMLWAISPQSNWLSLEPGDNEFRAYASGAAIPWTLEFTKKYGAL